MVFGAHPINICLCDDFIIMVQRGAFIYIYIYNLVFGGWGMTYKIWVFLKMVDAQITMVVDLY